MLRTSILLISLVGMSYFVIPTHEEDIKRVVQTIAFESFEGTAGELGYTSDDWRRGFSDYSSRVSDQNAGSGNTVTYHIASGVPSNLHDDGTGDKYFYAVDDLDDSGNTRTDDLSIITFNNVDVTNATSLKVKLLLGVDRELRFEADDYIQIYYAFDADISAHPGTGTAFAKGNYTLLADFRGSGTNTNVSQDADFNGSGDGNVFLPFGTFTISGPNNDLVMSDLSFDISGTGTNLSVRIVMQSDGSDETFIIDNVRIEGDVPASAPTSATVAASVFLEGAYNGTNLNTTLNGSIPLTQPYTNNGHSGGTAASIPANAVDWILVELREAGSAAAALNSTKVGSTAGFLMNDGTVKATDGTSDLTVSLSGNTGSDFFVVIYHRNHLSVMSANAISESGGKYTIDFTSNSANTYQTTTALVSLAGSKFGMPSGDADADGDVDATDLTTWRSGNGATFSYSSNGKLDLNLDGAINAVDRNLYWRSNSSASKMSQVPTT